MTDLFDLGGRVALVTGATQGLGFEIAAALATAGASVWLNGRNMERLERAAQLLRERDLDVRTSCFDVADEGAAAIAVDDICAEEGRLDVLVNNVGNRLRRPLEEIDAGALRSLLDVNLVAAFALSRLCARHMSRSGQGRIINVSSVAAERARAGDSAYIIAKGAMNSMTRALAAEFGPAGITCNVILPGPFTTETNREAFEARERDGWFRDRIPLQRPGSPSEIGGVAVFLASASASYVSGAMIPVDGGYMGAS